MLFGLSVDRHGLKSSVQALYSYETAIKGYDYGTHRVGLSIKADIEIGLVMDTLYTYDSEKATGLDGLSFSMGADYSFVNGKLIVLGEYLFNGEASSTAFGYGGYFPNRHYLYSGFTWIFNDFTNMNSALISSFDELSLTPVITVNHELFQGATLTLSTQIPFYRELIINEEDPDEQSSKLTANHVIFSVRLRLRF
jgi:hypothetical protein